MTWTPIWPKTVDVLGIHPQHARLLVVRLILTARPPSRWRALLLQAVLDVGLRLAVPMQIDDLGLEIALPDDALEPELRYLESAIRKANQQMAAEERPERQSAGTPVRNWTTTMELQETMSQDLRNRLTRARQVAQAMSGVFQSSLWANESVQTDEVRGRTPRPAMPSAGSSVRKPRESSTSDEYAIRAPTAIGGRRHEVKAAPASLRAAGMKNDTLEIATARALDAPRPPRPVSDVAAVIKRDS